MANFLGISRLRGVVMYELQSTLSTYAKRKYSSGEISVEHLKNILKVRFFRIFPELKVIPLLIFFYLYSYPPITSASRTKQHPFSADLARGTHWLS